MNQREDKTSMKTSYDMKSFWNLIRNWKLRNILHLKPQYILSRIRVLLYEARHPEYPWFTQQANLILSTLLKPKDIGIEWGSGMSTLWFARRVKHLVSVEHDESWYELILNKLQSKNIANVNYLLLQADKHKNPEKSPYVQIINTFNKNSLDFVFVDGKYRDVCACMALSKIRHGGFILIDDANRFFPCDSISPGSRLINHSPASERWAVFLDKCKNWRYIWTSNGVKDTAIYFKP